MPDNIQILYNGAGVFSNPTQPIPFVGLDETNLYYGERWATRETLTLNGQVTGCSFGDIVTGFNTIVDRFRVNYQPLEIWQTQNNVSGRVFLKEQVEVESIDVPDNRWFGAMPYTITLNCYPSGYFSGVYGVLDPIDTWDFTEQQDATLEIRHNISCRGINTSRGTNNSLDNARIWAAGRTGVNSTVYPALISGVSPSNFCLITQTENIDRFNATYSYTEIYTNDLARSGYGVIRYSTDVESGINAITVGLNGTAEGGGLNITGLRYAFNRLDKLAIATKAYQSLFNRIDLNPVPLSQSFNEDPFETRINFSYQYDNDNSPQVFFDYTVDMSVGTNGFINTSIQGVVKARGGSLASKLAQTSTYADMINLYNLVLPFYTSFDASSIAPLNPVATSQGRTINQSNGSIDLNASFTNAAQPNSLLDNFNWTMEFRPTVMRVDSKPKLDGFGAYSVVSLGYGQRAALSINGTAVCHAGISVAQGAAAVKQTCYGFFSQYGKFAAATLDQESVTTNDNKTLSFSFSWSFDGSQVIGPETISSLTI